MSAHRSPRLRSAAPAAALAALLSALVIAATAPSAGAVSLVRCLGTESLAYSPGLTNTPGPSTVTLTAILSPCASATPLWIGAATASKSFSPPAASCTDLLGAGSSSIVYRWSDATTSTFTYNTTMNRVRGQLVITEIGTITAGRYSGSTALGTIVAPGDLTACATPAGLTRITGAYTFDILL